ncbi:MAG: 7-cyano-7-deazaguanine synthase QueC [Candidatus Margulisiibacteriota bacterium]
MKKAVVLLSGGLDSTTTLYYALDKGYACQALIFDYGQRHKRELRSAVAVAKRARVSYQILKISLPWKGSALLDAKVKVPTGRSLKKMATEIPSTYVPARNTIFLSFALSFAEAIGAQAIFIGANALDYSGYPDCRPDYYAAYQKVIEKGTKAKKIKIVTPLIDLTKEEIIKLGRKLGAPLEMTWSCYQGGKEPCGVCDSCRLREKGFSLYNKAS